MKLKSRISGLLYRNLLMNMPSKEWKRLETTDMILELSLSA